MRDVKSNADYWTQKHDDNWGAPGGLTA